MWRILNILWRITLPRRFSASRILLRVWRRDCSPSKVSHVCSWHYIAKCRTAVAVDLGSRFRVT